MAQAGFERFAPIERVIDVRGTVYRFWQPPDVDALIDVAAFEADERIPYWANVWESALVLAEDLAALDGRGRTLLELGCGLGLPAIVAGRQGFAATASDYEEPALEGVRFDVVVAADVLYEKHHAVALAAVIARTLAPAGTALVADPGRARAAELEPAARAVGLTVEKTPARRPQGATDGPEIDVYVLQWPGCRT
jgi:predicted nicotinamide N-methyase